MLSLGGEGKKSKAQLSLLVTVLGCHRRPGRKKELRKPQRVLWIAGMLTEHQAADG